MAKGGHKIGSNDVVFVVVVLVAGGVTIFGFLLYIGAHEYYPGDFWYYWRGPLTIVIGIALLAIASILRSRAKKRVR